MAAIPPDYDTDADRWASRDSTWLIAGDIHEVVAQRIAAEALHPVLDVGSGYGRLRELLPDGWPWIGIDSSPTQLSGDRVGPAVLGDAAHLPFASGTFPAVAALWMLYHLDDPLVAIREAHRALKPGGLFIASTSRRDDSPEVQPAQDATTFDSEEAPTIVGQVFDDVEVESWDTPMLTLPDRDAVRLYLTSRIADPALADNIDTPVTITKRGCIVWGRKH